MMQVAVWGWSYGGYATLAILGNERQEICTCGISVAPVTNWRYYGNSIGTYSSKIYFVMNCNTLLMFLLFSDSVYSERYMGQPDLTGNFRGYQDSNIVQKFKNLKRGNVTERKVIFSSCAFK